MCLLLPHVLTLSYHWVLHLFSLDASKRLTFPILSEVTVLVDFGVDILFYEGLMKD